MCFSDLHSEYSDEIKQKEDKELSRRSSKSSKKVQDDIESHSNHELDGYICDDTSYSFSERMIESVGMVLFDDCPLVVELVDFVDCHQSVQQDGEEEDTALLEERVSVVWCVIENRTDDHWLGLGYILATGLNLEGHLRAITVCPIIRVIVAAMSFHKRW